MATTTCPNCGKQLRPGARFCGNCGTTLPASPPARPAGVDAQAGAPAESLPCPNCGKPVRKGARFCSHCGYTLAADPGASAVTAPEPAASTGASAPTLAGADGGARSAAEKRPAPALPPAAVGPRRSGLPWILLIGLAGVCLVVVVGGFLLASSWGWIAAAQTPTEVSAVLPISTDAPLLTDTPVSVETSVSTESPISTEMPISTDTPVSTDMTIVTDLPETTPASLDTVTPEVIPTEAALVTEELLPTIISGTPAALSPAPTAALGPTLLVPPAAITATVPISPSGSGPEVVIEDAFDGQLSDNWLTWGSPRATIDRGPGDKWLSLKADDPGSGGVTTRTGITIFNVPGLEIEFQGALQDRYPRSVIYLDWDPAQTRRGTEMRDPGLIRLELHSDLVTLLAPLTKQSCNAPLDAFQQHRFVVRMTETQGLELYLDDGEKPACALDFMGLATVPGRVSFSGLGWVSYVKIAQPAIQQ